MLEIEKVVAGGVDETLWKNLNTIWKVEMAPGRRGEFSMRTVGVSVFTDESDMRGWDRRQVRGESQFVGGNTAP